MVCYNVILGFTDSQNVLIHLNLNFEKLTPKQYFCHLKLHKSLVIFRNKMNRNYFCYMITRFSKTGKENNFKNLSNSSKTIIVITKSIYLELFNQKLM